jgi:dTDP-4-dehydrorhamnose 3,5-epimerase
MGVGRDDRGETAVDVEKTPLEGALVITPKKFGDERGWFMPGWNAAAYAAVGVPGPFVQDNISHSVRGTLRGLHFQNPDAQGKLVQALVGAVYDVAVDVRVGSPSFGRWHAVTLSAENRKQFYIPQGFAHGFAVLSDTALFHYKIDGGGYNPAAEHSLLWNDPALSIPWPVADPILSEKDVKGKPLADFAEADLPRYVAVSAAAAEKIFGDQFGGG